METVQKGWLTETAKTRKELKANGKKLLSQLQTAQSNVEKAKQKFEGSRKKQDSVQAEANADPNPKARAPNLANLALHLMNSCVCTEPKEAADRSEERREGR